MMDNIHAEMLVYELGQLRDHAKELVGCLGRMNELRDKDIEFQRIRLQFIEYWSVKGSELEKFRAAVNAV